MAMRRSLNLFWCLAFLAIVTGGITLLWLGHFQSSAQIPQKIVQVQYDISFQLGKRLRAQGETSCSTLLGTWLVSMGTLGIAFPLLAGFILCRGHLSRSLSAYPGSGTGHWKIIFRSIRQTYWRLNIFRFEKLTVHLVLLGVLLFAIQVWWLPFCFQPLNLTGIFLLCYLCGCYICLLSFYRQFYSLKETVRILETRLGLKQRLTTSLELVPAKVNPFYTVLITQTAEKLEGQEISRLLPHTWPFIPRRAFFYQLASITLAALILDWAGPSLVASYYVPRTSEKYTRKISAQLDKLLTVQAQELNRMSQELYLKQDSLDPQILADKLATLADDLKHLAAQDTAGSGQTEPPSQARSWQFLKPQTSNLKPAIPQGILQYAEESDTGRLSRLAKQFLSPVVINANQSNKASNAARKEWLRQTAQKLKDWQSELKDMINQTDSGQTAGVVLSASPSPPPQEEKTVASNSQPKPSVAPQLKEVARKIESLKISSTRNLPVVSAIKSNLWQQAEQLKEMAEKIEKVEKEQGDEVDFSQQYKQIGKELSEMSREMKEWNGMMDALHVQANAGSQFRQKGYLSNTTFPMTLDRGGTGSNPLADARVIMGEQGASDPNAAPKLRIKGESDPHFHPKVTDLTMDEADTSSQSDIGERAAIITHGKDQGSSPDHNDEQGQERKQGQVLSGEKHASQPGSSPSSAKVGGNLHAGMADSERLSQMVSLTQAAQDTLKELKANLGAGTSPPTTGVEELRQAAADMETLADQVQWAGDSGNAKADMLKNQAGRELKRMAGQLNMLAQKQIQQQNRDQNSRESDKRFLQEKLGESEKKLAELSSQLNNAAKGLLAGSPQHKAEPEFTAKDMAYLNSIADELNRLAKSVADVKSTKLSNSNHQQAGGIPPFGTKQNKNVGLDKAQPNLPNYQVAGERKRKEHQEKGDGFDKQKLQAVADGLGDVSQKIDKLEKEMKHPERQDDDQFESQQLLITKKMEQLGQELRSNFDEAPPQIRPDTKRLGLEMESLAQGISTWGKQASEPLPGDINGQPGQTTESDLVDAEFTAAWLNLPGGKPREEPGQQKQNEQKISSQFASARVQYDKKQFSAMDKLQRFLQDIRQLEQKVAGQRRQTNSDKSGSGKELSLGTASKLQQIQEGQAVSPNAQGKSSPYPQEEKLDSQDTFERIAARVQVMYQEIAAAGMGDMPKGYQIPRSDLSQFNQPEGLGNLRSLTVKEKEEYISRPANEHLPDPLPHNTAVSYKPESAQDALTEVNFTVKGDSPYAGSGSSAPDNHAPGLHQAPTMDRAVQQQTIPLAYRRIIQGLYQR